MQEFARILKPAGHLIISFPNNSDLRRRLLFLLTGSVTWNVIGPPSICSPEVENPASCFRYPMTLANVLSGIDSVGFKCELIRSTHWSKSAIVLSPFILWLKLFSILAPKRYKNVFDKKLFRVKLLPPEAVACFIRPGRCDIFNVFYSNNFLCLSSISLSFFCCHFTYFLIRSSSNPTVLTQYPRDQKCRPQNFLPTLSYF